MKVYVATKISNREQGILLAYKLTRLGHEITSRWLECEKETRPEERTGKAWERFSQEWGKKDMDDVLKSDALVVLICEGAKGTWVEFGLALGANKKIHFVGDKNHTVFSHLEETPDGTKIEYHRDAEELVEQLAFERVGLPSRRR